MGHIKKHTILACCLGIAFTGALPLFAQEKQVPQAAAEIKLSFAPIVKKTAAAVVNVYGARREVRGRATLYDDPVFREFFGGGQGAGRERVQQSVGSGVIVAAEGIIITNHHVIEGMTEVKIALADKRELEAEIVLRDPRTDLAVLKIKSAEKLTPIELADSDTLEIGDVVLAIGNPFGVGQTVTQGIVSALARTQVGISDYQFFIQTDAAINPGNSGGALVDMQGKLAGINTAIFSRSGGNQGIGFAIPANMVRVIIQSAKGGGVSVKRPWFGAKLQSVTTEIAEGLGLNRPVGALVANIVDGSPAAESGLKRSDVITAVDGVDVDDPDSFGYRFSTKGISGQTSLTVLRGGKKLVFPVSLKLAPEVPARELVKIRGDNATPFAGASVVNLSPAVAEELSLSTDQKGVVISDIESGSVSEQLGFQKGDILLAVNGVNVISTYEVSGIFKRGRVPFWRIEINRGGQVINTVFGG
jgi:Do/DeqQ family serine protease